MGTTTSATLSRSRLRAARGFAAGAVLGYVTVSLAESLLHGGVQHASAGTRKRLRDTRLGAAIARAHLSHSVVHHRMTFRRDHVTQFDGDGHEARVRDWILRHTPSNRIIRDRYGLSLAVPEGIASFLVPVLPIFAAYGARASWPVRAGLTVPLAVYPLSSRWLHPYLHMSQDEIAYRASRPMRWLLATPAVRYVARHHWVHHRDDTVNFNLLPLGDWVLGRSRPPSGAEVAEMRQIGMLV